MKERRFRQPGLFDAVIPPVEPSMALGAETLAMLCILLVEAVAAGSKVMLAKSAEVDDDHNRH